MKVSGVANSNANQKKRPLINAKSTGYVATVGMGLSMLSGHSKNKFLKKNHKFFACTAFIAVIAHIGLISTKHKSKN